MYNMESEVPNGYAEFYADAFVARAVTESNESLSLSLLLSQTISMATSPTILVIF